MKHPSRHLTSAPPRCSRSTRRLLSRNKISSSSSVRLWMRSSNTTIVSRVAQRRLRLYRFMAPQDAPLSGYHAVLSLRTLFRQTISPRPSPAVFPYGRGGPYPPDHNEMGEVANGLLRGMTLLSWAKVVLQRHGGHCAQHPAFSFLVFNMHLRSQNRRIAQGRLKRSAFRRIEGLHQRLTPRASSRGAEGDDGVWENNRRRTSLRL